MVKLLKLEPLTKEYLESINCYWHTDTDDTPYIGGELVEISQSEAQAYYDAANELYDMYINAAQHVIDNNLFHEVGIPFNLVDIVKNSWENDVHWHLYGRFDLAGGIDGKPIKLIEFNADTPTSLYESSIIQWAILKKNGLNEASQFNNIYDALKENFRRLVVLHSDTDEFAKYYEGWKILFSSMAGNSEDEVTTKFLQNAAQEAGFHTDFAYADEVSFSEEEGVFKGDENFEFWFKLIPWEDIAIKEPNLALILKDIIKNQKAIILNPAYTLLFQSKAMLKILWDLYPSHPLLLETAFEPLRKKCVKKHSFGREGANTTIFEVNGNIVEKTDGEYENFVPIYQEYVEFPKDISGNSYQAGVFFAYEGCGLGFRRGGLILNNYAKFTGHIIKD
ncbi:MAG: glutathionylspermidine synthase family protein [Campylobacteraceae bacterium]|jgi:glutathionylspermidine synthase|nr:glutathionylspermidine synthase family protein [Campylobacteraceae bacterium]